MDPEIEKINTQLLLFASLAVICEILRRCIVEKPAVAQRCRIASLVLAWFAVSTTLTLFNKWMMTRWNGSGLHCPIFYSMSHMFLKGVYSYIWLLCKGRRPWSLELSTVLRASFGGCMTALDIAAQNEAILVGVAVVLSTMMRSLGLMFVLFCATALGVERCSLGITAAVSVVSLGLFLTTVGGTGFDTVGFLLILSSNTCSALRWVYTQMVLQRAYGGLDAVMTIWAQSPAATLTLVPLVLVHERDQVAAIFTDPHAALAYVVVLFPGTLAFFLLLFEIEVIRDTSALSMTVCSQLQGILLVIMASAIFGEHPSMLAGIGFAITVFGMVGYAYLKELQVADARETAPADYQLLAGDSAQAS